MTFRELSQYGQNTPVSTQAAHYDYLEVLIISDCFFAPVALRFKTYDIHLSGKAAEYQASMLEHPSVVEWVRLALRESEVVPENEV